MMWERVIDAAETVLETVAGIVAVVALALSTLLSPDPWADWST